MMPAEEALARYEAVRHRLPAPRNPGACRRVTDLSALTDRFDTFLLDAFGVLNIGERAIPGAPQRIAALQAAGKRVMVLTNAASVPRAALVAKYARLGYRFAPGDVISSRDVLLASFAPEPGQDWGVMAVPAVQDQALDHLPVRFLDDDPATYDRVDGFLLLGSGEWTDARQLLLTRALERRPRPVLVGNPDIVAPRQGGFSLEPGYFAHALADSCGAKPMFFGKPFGNIYAHAFAAVGAPLDLARTVMVGDSLHTDILGGQTAGVASALITGFGFLAGMPVEDAIRRSGILPDFLLARP